MQGEGELLDADGTVTITPALFGSSVAAGTKISVLSGAKTLWSGTPAHAAASYALIIPGLANGTRYTVQTGSASSSITAATSAPRMGGDRQGGERGGQGGHR